ncbi:helix-turn-helix domain-containing protein [Croceicoccus mobilis]|uniref:XRE family transcriptional regulator n=1 Tax=Croceicoccus mobilis TaxID=1703339 RepID=A0A916Z7E3_9SPHN|nr:helix-turn-helix transcriptional regulator [Croceicoccus mobilis]GGD79622.1 XRE family transcriptional regulator [Croceicoccus mobilis]
MARKAIYLGPRLKRMRRELGLTQANMAEDLDVSPSYIALMERNQRPVTADLLLKIATTYRIDISDLAAGDSEEVTTRLQAVLRDPIFADIDLPSLDVADIATSYPGFAEALMRLHTAYGEEQLALAARRETERGGGGAAAASVIDPVAEARNFLAARRNCFPTLDDSASLAAQDLPTISSMIARIKEKHRLEVTFAPPEVLRGAMRWYDYHRRRVMFSRQLDHKARRFQLALQLAVLERGEEIEAAIGEGRFESDNGKVLARRALESYWAAALLMPYRPFLDAAKRLRYDMDALTYEFQVSYEQVAHRLTTLQRPGAEGVPFFFIRVDRAGNVSKRLDGAGFPFARHGGACPLWNVHKAFDREGEVLVQRIELPDGERYMSVARTVISGGGSFHAQRITRAVALCCADARKGELVYGDALKEDEVTPIGIACRFCHRPQCIARSAPPMGRELRFDHYRQSGVPFAFADE